MKSATNPRPSTLHVRNFRARMREQGLVKKDVWIRPEHARELQAIEQRLREPEAGANVPGAEVDGAGPWRPWSAASIHHALAQSSAVRHGLVDIDLIDGAEPSLHLVMHEYGDLSVFLAVGGEQILVEAYLWPVADVSDPDVFNAHVLRTHKLLPLSSISLQDVAGVPSYTMFGALDMHTSLPSLMVEVEALADNVIAATEAYSDFLLPQEDAA